MTAILGFAALATDVGMMFRAKRNVQMAADAAATAAALDMSYGLSYSASANASASANGFTNGSGGTVVTASSPPADGPNTVCASCVEVQISQPNPTFFMKVFGMGQMTVVARSVAGMPNPGNGCVYIMNPTASDSLDLQGGYDVNAPGCGIYVNSNSSTAVKVTGNGGIVNAQYLDIVGGISGTTSPTSPATGVAALNDPFDDQAGPTPPSGCTSTSNSTSVSGSINAGSATSVLCFKKAVTLGDGTTMGPGLYLFENGVTISGTVTVNSGTLDIYSGTYNQPSNTLLDITAPQSGTYNAIALLQPVSNTNELQVQFGSSNQTFDGYIYAPGAFVYLQDNGGGVTTTGVIANTMQVKSSSVNIPSYNTAHPDTTPVRTVALME